MCLHLYKHWAGLMDYMKSSPQCLIGNVPVLIVLASACCYSCLVPSHYQRNEEEEEEEKVRKT